MFNRTKKTSQTNTLVKYFELTKTNRLSESKESTDNLDCNDFYKACLAEEFEEHVREELPSSSNVLSENEEAEEYLRKECRLPNVLSQKEVCI